MLLEVGIGNTQSSDDRQLSHGYALLMVDSSPQHAAFAERLNEVLKTNNKSITDLMDMAGVTYEMARRYLRGIAKPRDEKVRMIANALHCSELYLQYGLTGVADAAASYEPTTSKPPRESNAVESRLIAVEWDDQDQDSDEFCTVPLIDVELSAGDGSSVLVEVEQYKLPFRRYTLRKHGVEPDQVRVARVTGNSMDPILCHDDVVGVDISKKSIVDGKVYAIRDGDLLRVKILVNRPDGGIIIKSYNKEDYPDEILTKDERQDRITVIGRIWWSSKLW
jgi:phage repressor protein C with HTH and peptisase S24 domain